MKHLFYLIGLSEQILSEQHFLTLELIFHINMPMATTLKADTCLRGILAEISRDSD